MAPKTWLQLPGALANQHEELVKKVYAAKTPALYVLRYLPRMEGVGQDFEIQTLRSIYITTVTYIPIGTCILDTHSALRRSS